MYSFINNETIIQDVSYDVEVLKALSLKQTDYTGETGYMTNELGGYVFEIAFTINSSHQLSKAALTIKNTKDSHTFSGKVYGIK